MFVFGLGNPGKEYEKTRHNVGFMVLDEVASLFGVQFSKKMFKRYLYAKVNDGRDILVKPLTFMNSSGTIIPSLIKQKEKLLVISDQMDLPCGKVRIKKNGGSAGHKGLKSIIEYYGEDFIHLYIGIGRGENISVPDYVLSPFKSDEVPLINDAFIVARDVIKRVLEGEDLNRICECVNARK